MPNPPDRTLIYIDTTTHVKLKELAHDYDSTIIELIRELVDSEYQKVK